MRLVITRRNRLSTALLSGSARKSKTNFKRKCRKGFRKGGKENFHLFERMKDLQWLNRTWETISRQLKVDKVYIETYRSRRIVDEQLSDPERCRSGSQCGVLAHQFARATISIVFGCEFVLASSRASRASRRSAPDG